MSFVIVLLGGYGLICLLAYLLQDRLLFFPTSGVASDPSSYGIPFDDVRLVTSDGVRLHAWFLPTSPEGEAAQGAVVFLHGNAGNIEHRIPSAEAFLDMGFACLLVDYRGYGRSEGRPSEEGTYLDAVAAYEYLSSERGVPAERIVAYGESLGGAVAIELAKRRNVAAVIVESSFRSLPAIAARHYPWLPVRWIARSRYDSESKVASLGVPLLVIHSMDDEIVPFEHGRELHERAREPKAFLETDGGHNDGGFLRRSEWRERVADLLHGWLAPETKQADG